MLALSILVAAGCSPAGSNGAAGSGDGGGGFGGAAGRGGDAPGQGGGGAGGEGGAPEPATLLGSGAPVEIVTVADAADGLAVPRDLAFHPDRTGELWIVNRADDSVTIVFDATGAATRSEHRIDPYALHFMDEVSSIAMGARNFHDDRSFATCQESRNTYDHHEAPNDFMGPALWSADLGVFAEVNPIGLGSHIDMLHQSPLCMGIAHERDNVYWVLDGLDGAIVRYDFQRDHGAGYDDHSDGIVRFFDEPKVKRLPDIPSHMVIDPVTGMLYVADAAGGRVLQIDTASGSFSRSLEPKEDGTTVEEWTGTVWSELVPSGKLGIPSGIALHEGIVYVGDNASGVIFAYDLQGRLLDQRGTGVRDLMGIEPGPDGRLYLVDARESRVLRIERR